MAGYYLSRLRQENLQFFANKSGIPVIRQAINSNLPHAVDRAVERSVFNNSAQATNALNKLSKNITQSGFPLLIEF